MISRSSAQFSDPAQQAVIDRFNSLYDALPRSGGALDFAAVIAECIDAYDTAKRRNTLSLAAKRA